MASLSFLKVLPRVCLVMLAGAAAALPQTAEQMGAILQRLDQLEKQNNQLLEQIKSLRALVAAEGKPSATVETPPAEAQPLNERQDVSEHRLEELAQTKVEASQKYPIQLTGMALFNAFSNGRYNGGDDNPTAASLNAGERNSGATLRQTVLGLKFRGPQSLLGGSVSGSVYMDFFGGSTQSLNHLVRLRLATIQIDWPHTTFAVGQDKPIVSRREPNSLAQVGVSPLTGAGNPWLWQPQARLEQRFSLTDQTAIKAEAGIYQTSEVAHRYDDTNAQLEKARPSFETRVAISHQFGGDRVLEVAPVFHTSTSHVMGQSIPSRLFGLDWLFKPATKFEVTGLAFRGQNFANLGAAGGITIPNDERAIAVHGNGGWAQLRYLATSKLSFDFYGGLQDDRNRDLLGGDLSRNSYLAANAMYLLAPNVLAAFEFGQARSNYLNAGIRLNNHYDLAIAYLF